MRSGNKEVILYYSSSSQPSCPVVVRTYAFETSASAVAPNSPAKSPDSAPLVSVRC